ncbi:hypothetical protein BASA50_006235 [Batrachochytrium salamandrivorans]|uniref:Orn/DAP/Arg decarboxylase 2 N-terminal domain-containing protein n=1 Tax=Batrachochytrium salamandrivorans TaxID=1357716 RepID=A0ABQ8FAG0_9FUNG|nr:hypothetical protein BASA60_006706 [Batrachochytrium salamandrivorans]KAH6594883.1 hypothetical protein BASA50_006235 [Batrachochytrium salamandrivorans]KAH9249788.1 hypothetical protein BASA81_012466 [Batrachochytrium salamandrivorans]KAH9264988.1 hypothetical protein BASA83_011504 [Batrachochytrium salamandrivorans]
MKEIVATFTPTVDTTGCLLSGLKAHKTTVQDASSCVKTDRRSISSILQSRVMSTETSPETEDPFFVADLGDIERQHAQWKKLLPRVEPFYAIKCNPNERVLQTLAALNTGFDCASKGEIDMVLKQGVDASRIIYANPCKQASHIRHAGERGVKTMTFDNADELYKVKQVMPDAKMVLRILTDDSRSVCRFGIKFGASLATVPSLLRTARELDIAVIGISFHVGSGCYDASAFSEAVLLARKAFDIGKALGFDFTLLDIGGGFPGRSTEGLQFADVARLLGPTIDDNFPAEIRVIAEPGRYFVSSAFTLAVNIIARRVVFRDNTDTSSDELSVSSQVSLDSDGNATNANLHPSYMYYINDGMYGSFNCLTFDHAVVKAVPLVRQGEYLYDTVDAGSSLPQFACSIWGPTCDSIDCIGRDCLLPAMKVGEWLSFASMGAYTMAAASAFNGFKKSVIIYTNSN